MSNADDNKPKVRRRRSRATISGTTQSGFANQSMSNILKGQRNAGADKKGNKPSDSKEQPDEH